MRKRTGLRNRWRKKTGSYSNHRKGRMADKYGSYDARKCLRPDIVAGHELRAITRDPPEGMPN